MGINWRELIKWYLILFCLFIGACTNLSQKSQKIIGGEHVKDITYAQIIQDKDTHSSSPVRLGGLIIDVENKENYSLVQALFFPLNRSGEPQLDKNSGGRFVIKSTDFFDPIIYTNNRKITVVGIINGEIERTVGERVIKVPLILTSDTHLWPHEIFYDHNNHYYSEDHEDEYDHAH